MSPAPWSSVDSVSVVCFCKKTSQTSLAVKKRQSHGRTNNTLMILPYRLTAACVRGALEDGFPTLEVMRSFIRLSKGKKSFSYIELSLLFIFKSNSMKEM